MFLRRNSNDSSNSVGKYGGGGGGGSRNKGIIPKYPLSAQSHRVAFFEDITALNCIGGGFNSRSHEGVFSLHIGRHIEFELRIYRAEKRKTRFIGTTGARIKQIRTPHSDKGRFSRLLESVRFMKSWT